MGRDRRRGQGPLPQYNRPVNDTVILHAGPTPSAPALVEVFRDPELRHWTSSAVENEADAIRWVQGQEPGWEAGDRFGFAVLETQPDRSQGQLVGNAVLKEVASGKPSAEVGYWAAAHARGRGVAPRALEALTDWAFDTLGADGLERQELLHRLDNSASCRVAHKSRYDLDSVLPAAPPSFPREGHLHVRRRDA